MPRYIDADALRQRMYHEAFETDTDMQKWDSGCWIRYKLFENCIESAPTVSPDDVLGVGKWIRQEKSHPNCPEDSDYRYECSVCGWSDQHNAKMIVPFCWHCGARMKGAEDGTTDTEKY